MGVSAGFTIAFMMSPDAGQALLDESWLMPRLCPTSCAPIAALNASFAASIWLMPPLLRVWHMLPTPA